MGGVDGLSPFGVSELVDGSEGLGQASSSSKVGSSSGQPGGSVLLVSISQSLDVLSSDKMVSPVSGSEDVVPFLVEGLMGSMSSGGEALVELGPVSPLFSDSLSVSSEMLGVSLPPLSSHLSVVAMVSSSVVSVKLSP